MGNLKRYTVYTALMLAIFSFGCVKSQLAGLHTSSFESTAKCASRDKTLQFQNTTEKALTISGILFAPGTNGEGNFSLLGLKIGDEAEKAPLANGGFASNETNPLSVPAGAQYSLRVRYSPVEETEEEENHTAFISIGYGEPTPGVFQVELSGTSSGVAECAQASEGVATELEGKVNITITKLIAVTNELAVPLSSDNGAECFVPVTLKGNIAGLNFTFPQIREEDNFILPPLNPTDPALDSVRDTVIFGATRIFSAVPINGTFTSQTGQFNLPGVQVFMEDDESFLTLNIDLHTATATPEAVSRQTLQKGDFDILVNGSIAGTPLQSDGMIKLIGLTSIKQSDVEGPLATGAGRELAIRIEAIVTCIDGETTSCTLDPAVAAQPPACNK
jgi:hypothetical protein